jgi:hypothetical protein
MSIIKKAPEPVPVRIAYIIRISITYTTDRQETGQCRGANHTGGGRESETHPAFEIWVQLKLWCNIRSFDAGRCIKLGNLADPPSKKKLTRRAGFEPLPGLPY